MSRNALLYRASNRAHRPQAFLRWLRSDQLSMHKGWRAENLRLIAFLLFNIYPNHEFLPITPDSKTRFQYRCRKFSTTMGMIGIPAFKTKWTPPFVREMSNGLDRDEWLRHIGVLGDNMTTF